MRAFGLGTVVAAGPNSKFKTGDLVSGELGGRSRLPFQKEAVCDDILPPGWCDYAVLNDKALQKIE